MEWNITLFRWLNNIAGQLIWLDNVIIFVANYLDVLLLAITFLVIVFLYDPRPRLSYFEWAEIKQRIKGLGVVVLSTGLAWVVAVFLKYVFKVPRPYIALENVTLLFSYGGYDSFPSGHATFFAALAVALYIYNARIGSLFGFFAILIGVSRVIAGIHFPIDVLVGYVLGGLLSWFVYKLYKRAHKKGTLVPWLKRLS